MDSPPKPVRINALARILGLGHQWLLSEARAGRIPHLTAGQVFLFDPRAVQAALARMAAESPARPSAAEQGRQPTIIRIATGAA